MVDISNKFLAAILTQIKAIKVPTDLVPGSAEADALQQLLAPLESNPDPNNPGLRQIFEQANNKVSRQTAAINATDVPDPSMLVNLSQPLYDQWAAFQANQYLLYLSAKLGYPAPAADFYAPIIPSINARIHPDPIIFPAPPVPPPVPVPPVRVPPIVAPPTTITPPIGPPGPPVTPPPPVTSGAFRYLSASQSQWPGSGQPSNGNSLKTVLGVNSVKLNVFASIPSKTATTITWSNNNYDPTIVGGALDTLIDAYKITGLKIILSLEPTFADATPKSQFFPTDTVAFLTNLRILAVQLAAAATRKGVSAIIITPSLYPYSNNGDTPAAYMLQWRNIYAGCKGVFAGDVLYLAAAQNVGPIGNSMAMDWLNCWDAIGVQVYPPIGSALTTSVIKTQWETANDTETSYAKPVFGNNGWLRGLYTDWRATGRKIFLETGTIAGPGAVVTPPAPPPPTAVESPQGLNITTIGPVLYNSVLEAFTLVQSATAGLVIAVNGVVDATTANVSRLYYSNHTVYHQNTAGSWYSKTINSNPWLVAADPTVAPAPPPPPPPPPTITESADGTTVTTIGPIIYNAILEQWALVQSPTAGLVITVNGIIDTTTANVTKLLYLNHIVYQENDTFNWYAKAQSSDAWAQVSDPTIVIVPGPPPVTISGGFSISASAVPTPTGGVVNVNLTAKTGQVAMPELFGVSMGTGFGTWNNSFNDPNWVSQMRNLDMRHVRFQGEGIIRAIFGSGTTPNWGPIQPVINNFRNAFPNATSNVMWTGVDAGSPYEPNVLGSQCTQFIQHLDANNIFIRYFDLYNEPETKESQSDVATGERIVYSAIAQSIPRIKFGSSPPTYPGSGGYAMNSVDTGYSNYSYISSHTYQGANNTTDEAYAMSYGQAVVDDVRIKDGQGRGTWVPNGGVDGTAGLLHNGKVYSYSLSEYGLNYNGDTGAQNIIQGMANAIMCAQLTAQGVKTNILWETGLWDGCQGKYGWPADGNSPGACAYFLGKGGQKLPGNLVTQTANNGLNVLATDHGIMVINMQFSPVSGSVQIGGLLNSSITRWQQDPSTRSGNTSTVTQSALTNQNFPAQSITIYYP